jgi:acetyltransferase-like isoleucine patch superfamily enzyme
LLIKTKSTESRELFERVKVATRLSAALSAHCVDEPEPIRAAFEELTGKPAGDSLTLIPPFYADHGLNITVGRSVFIGYEGDVPPATLVAGVPAVVIRHL